MWEWQPGTPDCGAIKKMQLKIQTEVAQGKMSCVQVQAIIKY